MWSSRWGGPLRQSGPGGLSQFLRRIDPRPVPAVLMDVQWYRLQTSRAPQGKLAARWHFTLVGDRRGLSPHPLIEPSLLAATSARTGKPVRNRVRTYLTDPSAWDQRTHELFDGGAYRQHNPDVGKSGWNPLVHYVTIGESEGRKLDTPVDLALVAAQYRSDGIVTASATTQYAVDTSDRGEAHRVQTMLLEVRQRRLASSHAHGKSMPLDVDDRLHAVVVAAGEAPLLDACLESLARQTLGVTVTVLVDGLTEGAQSELARWAGLSVVHGSTLGDVLRVTAAGSTTNETVAIAVVDAAVTLDSRALELAIAQLDEPSVGVVVGKSLRPDGFIDNAGYVLWSDGGLFAYQRLDVRESDVSMHAREVDCGGGEFTVYRSSSISQVSLGDLDGSATDLHVHAAVCNRLDTLKWVARYQPDVMCVQTRLRNAEPWTPATWGPFPGHPSVGSITSDFAAHWRAARLAGTLFIDELLPVPSYGSGYPRAHALAASVTRVRRKHVAIYALDESSDVDWNEIRDLLHAGVECHTSGGRAGLADFLRENHGRFDTLVVARHPTLELVLNIRDAAPDLFAGKRLVHDSEAIAAFRDHAKEALHSETADDPIFAAQISEELGPARQADLVLAATESEAQAMRTAGLSNVEVYRHALPAPQSTPGIADREGIVFVGRLLEEAAPNVDSVRWFLDEVLPLIRLEHPAPFTVIGRVTPTLATEFEAHGAIVVGGLRDIGPALCSARLMVAPTRFAAGIPIKVPTAAGHGTPVVVTPLLREQLGWKDGLEVAVGNGAVDFARAVVTLLEDDAVWERIHHGGLARLRAEYSTEALDELVSRTLL